MHIWCHLLLLTCCLDSSLFLYEQAWRLYEEDSLLDLVDDTLDPNEYEPDEAKRVIKIALLCTQSTVAARPTMLEIIILLLSFADSPRLLGCYVII